MTRAPRWQAAWVLAWLAIVGACGERKSLKSSAPEPLAASETATVRQGELHRMLPPEAYLRAYLLWFGGLTPRDVEARARGGGMFESWDPYLAALGLPDYKRDLPRQEQSNALMLSALGRLGEVLCARAAERDLHRNLPLTTRVVFRFEAAPTPDLASFSTALDVLHRKFLGYPLRLAPDTRAARLFALYREVASRHTGQASPLTADESAWAAVCTALVQHPEVEIY
jgi:hypothetical protein